MTIETTMLLLSILGLLNAVAILDLQSKHSSALSRIRALEAKVRP